MRIQINNALKGLKLERPNLNEFVTNIVREVKVSGNDDIRRVAIQALAAHASGLTSVHRLTDGEIAWWAQNPAILNKSDSDGQSDNGFLDSDGPVKSPPIITTPTSGDLIPISQSFNNYKYEVLDISQSTYQPQIFTPGASWRLPKSDGGKTETSFMGDTWTWLSAKDRQGGITVGLNGQAYGWAEKTVSRFLGKEHEWRSNNNPTIDILFYQAQGILKSLEKMGLDSLGIREKIKKASGGQELKFEVNGVSSVFSKEEVGQLQGLLSDLEQNEKDFNEKGDVLSKNPEEMKKLQKDYIQQSEKLYDQVINRLNPDKKALQETGRGVLIKAVSAGDQQAVIKLTNADKENIAIIKDIIVESTSAIKMAKAICLGMNPELKDIDGIDVETVLQAKLIGDALWGSQGPDRRYHDYNQPLRAENPTLTVKGGFPQKPVMEWETKDGIDFFEGDWISVRTRSLAASSFSSGGPGGAAKRLKGLILNLNPVKGPKGLFTEYTAAEKGVSIPLDIGYIEPIMLTSGQHGSLNPNNVFLAEGYRGNGGYFADPKTGLIMKWNNGSSIAFNPAEDGRYDAVNLGSATTAFNEVSLGHINDGAQKLSLQVAKKEVNYNGSIVIPQKIVKPSENATGDKKKKLKIRLALNPKKFLLLKRKQRLR